MVRRKLIHRVEGCVRSYQSYDDGGMWWYQSCDDEGVQCYQSYDDGGVWRSQSLDEGIWSY